MEEAVFNSSLLPALRQRDRKVVTNYYWHLYYKLLPQFQKRFTSYQMQAFEDCYPEAFLFLLRKLDDQSFVNRNIDGFAFRIIQGKFKDRLKRSQLIQTTSPEELPEPRTSISPSFARFIDLLEYRTALAHLTWFQRLQPQEQQIFDLLLQGYNLKEIGLVLGLTHGTVRNKYSRLIKEAQQVPESRFQETA